MAGKKRIDSSATAADGRRRKQPGRIGAVREHPAGSGKWQARFPAGWDPEKRGRRLAHPDNPFTSETAAWSAIEAERDLREKTAGNVEHAARSATRREQGEGVRTVYVMCAEYIEFRAYHVEAPIGQRTIDGYVQALNDQVSAPGTNLWSMEPRKVQNKDVIAWRDTLREDPTIHESGRWAGQPIHPKSSIDRAKALLSAAFGWEMETGLVDANPVNGVHNYYSKAAENRESGNTRKHIPFPKWAEIAVLVATPARHEDRVLISLLAFCGLRWSEAIALRVDDVNARNAEVLVKRVFVRGRAPASPDGSESESEDERVLREWVVEPVKSGQAKLVGLPKTLHEELLLLGQQRTSKSDLLFQGINYREEQPEFPIVNGSRWWKLVWQPARTAAGIDDLQVKDLRAYAASVIVDAGGTLSEAKELLRHASSVTTETHYTRARDIRADDTDRMSIRFAPEEMGLRTRMNRLFELWLDKYPATKARLIGGKNDDVMLGKSRRVTAKDVKKLRAWANKQQEFDGQVSATGAVKGYIVDAYLAKHPKEAKPVDTTLSGNLETRAKWKVARHRRRERLRELGDEASTVHRNPVQPARQPAQPAAATRSR